MERSEIGLDHQGGVIAAMHFIGIFKKAFCVERINPIIEKNLILKNVDFAKMNFERGRAVNISKPIDNDTAMIFGCIF